MVPADSCRISRVPHYSGAVSPWLPRFRLRGSHPLRPGFPAGSANVSPIALSTVLQPRLVLLPTLPVWAPARSLATTCAIVVTFFSSGYGDVSVPRVRFHLGWMTRSPAPGCPIRTSAHQRVFAPTRGFSQLVTSFFASESQGILHVPFSPFLFSF